MLTQPENEFAQALHSFNGQLQAVTAVVIPNLDPPQPVTELVRICL
jgi:hypothetical protein